MECSHRIVIDLGDVLTKGFVVGNRRVRRFRFPSVVAHRLLESQADTGSLLLDEGQALPRLEDFDASRYPRTRSYPGAELFLTSLRNEGHPVRRARFVGSLAAAYGADRCLLGRNPTPENIDALVRRTLMFLPEDCVETEVVFIVDLGVKAQAILTHGDGRVHRVRVSSWSYVRSEKRMRELMYHARVIDAPDCALAVLPEALDPGRVGATLIVDVGFLRTKLAVLSVEGCEQQQELSGLGVVDCVRRILRDGQELGLIEDEVAVIQAFEQGRDSLRVAGRTFEVGPAYESARVALEQELAKAANRMLLDYFSRRGAMCRGLAIVGGGAGVVADGLVTRLQKESRLDAVWVAEGKSYLLVEGARRRLGAGWRG